MHRSQTNILPIIFFVYPWLMCGKSFPWFRGSWLCLSKSYIQNLNDGYWFLSHWHKLNQYLKRGVMGFLFYQWSLISYDGWNDITGVSSQLHSPSAPFRWVFWFLGLLDDIKNPYFISVPYVSCLTNLPLWRIYYLELNFNLFLPLDRSKHHKLSLFPHKEVQFIHYYLS